MATCRVGKTAERLRALLRRLGVNVKGTALMGRVGEPDEVASVILALASSPAPTCSSMAVTSGWATINPARESNTARS
jgi:NAD(P)-dependent dehydrogenase (short-subunit alcohol dehydrogenase family)